MANAGQQQPVQANESHMMTGMGPNNVSPSFVLFLFFILLLIYIIYLAFIRPKKTNAGPQQSTKANNSQHRPTAASAGQPMTQTPV
jgi:hypothetical protein